MICQWCISNNLFFRGFLILIVILFHIHILLASAKWCSFADIISPNTESLNKFVSLSRSFKPIVPLKCKCSGIFLSHLKFSLHSSYSEPFAVKINGDEHSTTCTRSKTLISILKQNISNSAHHRIPRARSTGSYSQGL